MDGAIPQMMEGQMLSYMPALVPQAVRMAFAPGEQQQTGRLYRTGGKNDNFGDMLLLLRCVIRLIDKHSGLSGLVENNAAHGHIRVYLTQTSGFGA
jgi:hypothetical protein